MPRRLTMTDVAREAGVSVMTVSYVYNRPERVAATTRAAVLSVAAKLGYPGPDASARNLRKGSTGAVGVVLGEPLTYAFSDPQATAFLGGIATVCTAHELGLTLIPVNAGDGDLERVRRAAVDSFILWTTTEDDPVLEAVQARGLPAAIQGGPNVPGIHLVDADDRAAGAAIALVGLRGAARPAVLSFPLDRTRESGLLWGPDPASVPYPVTRARLEGYRDAVQAAGLSWAGVPVVVVSRNERSLAEAAVASLPGDVDALLAMSDELALGALDATPHRVPLELAVTGWDDSAGAAARGLSTVAQSLHEQGAACARHVLGDRALPPPTWRVVVRKTTRQ